MKIDAYGQHVYNETDIMSHYMRNPDSTIAAITTDSSIHFDPELELTSHPKIVDWIESVLPIEEYDAIMQSNWYMPQSYAELDIAKWVLDKCTTEPELQRVGEELLLYHQYDMFNHLRYMVYLVDLMRSKNIVWGVGRGSSIASYVLYLIGVHRINSMHYDLDIREFLR